MPEFEFEPVYRDIFPFWDTIPEGERIYICQNSHTAAFSKGEHIYNGNDCFGVIFVRSGSIRLYMMSDEGRDITLYRMHPGDMCMLSASCVLE